MPLVIMNVILLICFLICCCNCRSTTKCPGKVCPKINFDDLNVHIIPHSHQDVGWLKTIDQYYFGTRNNIQNVGVQYTYDSVLDALKFNKDRRFITVETSFFYKWWSLQNDERRQEFKNLVDNGQMEMVGGGWTMNDEACVNYLAVIDQFSYGFKVLKDTLGECGRPTTFWQIDPFGHSKEIASIFSQINENSALFFARADLRDKAQRLSSKTAEFMWWADQNLEKSKIFTSMFYRHYSAPPSFCFDVLCNDDSIINDARSSEYNYPKKIKDFANYIGLQADGYRTNQILVPMGDDFNFQDAHKYFYNVDLIIRGFKEYDMRYNNKTIRVFYSTPSCYLEAINEEMTRKNFNFPVFTGDFLPYADDLHSYWTGYFTSRSTSKAMERDGNNLLQVAKQLSSFLMDAKYESSLDELKSSIGIMQHHDAITGTEKQHVADDYHKILHEAINNVLTDTNHMLSTLFTRTTTTKNNNNLHFTSCLLANMSICNETMQDSFLVAVYNPLSRPVNHYVKLPVNHQDFIILGPNNETINYQITPSISKFSFIKNHTVGQYTLHFLAENVPPLGTQLYKIKKIIKKECDKCTLEADQTLKQFILGNEVIGITLNESTGFLNSVTIRGKQLAIEQEYLYYIGENMNNTQPKFRSSGAYIFRPANQYPEAQPIGKVRNITTYRGPLFDEVHQVFNDYLKQIIRVYKMEEFIEFDWLVGPVDISDNKAKEIITRFKTPLNSGDLFYTDANGRQMVKRRVDYREGYNYTNEEPVSGNYYPVTARILLKDDHDDLQVAIINDRSQGGTSLKNGQMELMIHRRLMNDDARGVGEALNETEFGQGIVVRGTHYLTFGSIYNKENISSSVEKKLVERINFNPWIFVSKADIDENEFFALCTNQVKGLKHALPPNVHILTLEPYDYKNKQILLRLEHIFEKDEHPVLSKPTVVNLQDIFNNFKIMDVEETTLDGNQKISKSSNNAFYNIRLRKRVNDLEIELNPMEIKTYLIKLENQHSHFHRFKYVSANIL